MRTDAGGDWIDAGLLDDAYRLSFAHSSALLTAKWSGPSPRIAAERPDVARTRWDVDGPCRHPRHRPCCPQVKGVCSRTSTRAIASRKPRAPNAACDWHG